MMPAGHHSDSDSTLLPLPKSSITWFGGIFARLPPLAAGLVSLRLGLWLGLELALGLWFGIGLIFRVGVRIRVNLTGIHLEKDMSALYNCVPF